MMPIKSLKLRTVSPQTVADSPSMPRNFLWTFFGNMVIVLCQWGILTAIARLGSPAMVGDYSWGLALTAPLVILASLSLREVLVTDAKGRFSFRTYSVLRFLCGLAVLFVLSVILTWFVPHSVPIILTVTIGVTKVFEMFSDLTYGYFQKVERMDVISRSMVLRGVCSLLVFTLLLAHTENLIVAAIGACFVSLGVLCLFDLPMLARTNRDAMSFASSSALGSDVVQLFQVAIPLGLAQSLISFSSNIPRYGLGAFSGSYALGIYSVLAYPLAAGNIVVSAVAGVSLPRLTRQLSDGDAAGYFRLLGKLCALAGVLAVSALVAVILVGEPVLALLFGAEYAAEHRVFVILVTSMGIGFFNWFLNSALTAARMYRWSLTLEVIGLFLTLVLSWALVPQYGLTGAAWVNVGVMLASAILKSMLVRLARGKIVANDTAA